jgi:DNA helicase IV
MADVLRRAVFSHVRKPVGDVVAIVGTKRYRISEHRLRRYVDDTRRADIHWSIARERLRTQLAEDVRRQREDAGGAPSDAETARVARSQQVRDFVDQVWPALDPRMLLARLYSDADFLRRSAPALTDQERSLLERSAPKAIRSVRWTAADAVLLVELAGLIEGVESFVHIVVDEAQDLSAMQCRAIARRCPLGSMTVLGDLAQATTTWAPGDWAQTLTHLGQDGAAVHPLTIGYRVPGEVLELANRLLPHIAKDVPPASSIRAGHDALTYRGRPELAEAVRGCLAEEGSVGVIARDADVATILDELRELGAEHIDAEDDSRLTVVPASAAKGLEFDSVVLVEPSQIADAEPTRPAGLRRLYVVLTRAVSRLVVVHDDLMPPELAAVNG